MNNLVHNADGNKFPIHSVVNKKKNSHFRVTLLPSRASFILLLSCLISSGRNPANIPGIRSQSLNPAEIRI